MAGSKAGSAAASRRLKGTFHYEKRLTEADILEYEQQHQEKKLGDIIAERQDAYESIDDLQTEIQQACHLASDTKQ
jgi:hypothetical protein